MKDAVLLAGGMGTRLESVSGGKPKPMVEVAGRPFIEYVLDVVRGAGCLRVVMAVSHRWQVMREHFGDAYKGLELCWSVETNPLGTGGAARFAFNSFRLERAFVVNADTLFLVDLRALEHRHWEERAQVTIALKHLEDVSRFGSVELDNDDRVVAFREKGRHGPGLINGGIYVIERSVFDVRDFPLKFSIEYDLLQVETDRLRPIGMRSSGYFVDIGIPAELERAQRELKKGRMPPGSSAGTTNGG